MRVARQAVCCALLGAFVISNPQCGAYRAGHAQLAHAYLRDGLYDQALAETRRAIRQDGPDDRLLLMAALARLGLDEVDAARISLSICSRANFPGTSHPTRSNPRSRIWPAISLLLLSRALIAATAFINALWVRGPLITSGRYILQIELRVPAD